jgi:hypothetical protein
MAQSCCLRKGARSLRFRQVQRSDRPGCNRREQPPVLPLGQAAVTESCDGGW